eukprot:GHRR01029220.1.p1 GENE.GHRR01029220.1~~GHRR01029220.1.p1  ORF type:complete len:214 (+),score=28.04 GHRR01029220.1:393-1034(+)
MHPAQADGHVNHRVIVIGDMEPQPVQVLPSPGADLDALRQFQYHPSCVLPPGTAQLQDCEGCKCNGPCLCQTQLPCPCAAECLKGLKVIREEGRAANVILLLECGSACGCSQCCQARPTQGGVTSPLGLVWSEQKGWCVKTLQDINQGSFVCEYAGEYVSGAEAAQRLADYDQQKRGHALLTVRLLLPSYTRSIRCSIDATDMGNVARYINHR